MLAERTGVAIVAIRHLTKGERGKPIYRGGGSIGIVGAARSALLVARHPEDDRQRVLAPVKSNLSKPPPLLAFALSEADNGAVRVEWRGETPHTAEMLLSAPASSKGRSALEEATDFLRDTLGDGPRSAKAIFEKAGQVDISEITLKRAKAELGVRSEKGSDGSWTWRLPEEKGIKVRRFPTDDPLDPLEPLGVTEGHSAREEDQGDQESQEDRAIGDERHAPADGERRPGGRCIHDVQGGCWLCKKAVGESEQA